VFVRIVSLIQIAAIIACPLWCSSGLCHAGQHCAIDGCSLMERTTPQFCPFHGTTRCCCNESSSPRNDHGPCRCPNKPCQGVCGGAVFDKPIELNDVRDSFFLPLIVTEISFALHVVECRSLDIEHHWHCHGGNHGRALRTLHMSFLC
jgi:hypothetical protein